MYLRNTFKTRKDLPCEVVDAVRWHDGVLLGHPNAASLLLLSDQPRGFLDGAVWP